MKVRVSFTVDIDADAWAGEYGVNGPAEIRDDVKDYVESSVLGHLESLDLLTRRPRRTA